MSELVDRMLKYQPPPNLTAEMGETVDDEIKYMKSTAELLSFRRNLVKIDNFRRKLVKLRRSASLKINNFRRKIVKLRRIPFLKLDPDPDSGLDPGPDPADPETQKSHTRFARATVAGLPGSNRLAILFILMEVVVGRPSLPC